MLKFEARGQIGVMIVQGKYHRIDDCARDANVIKSEPRSETWEGSVLWGRGPF